MPTDNESTAREEAIRKHYLRPRDTDYKTTPGQARNVIGVGVGPWNKPGTSVNERCVRFYVEKKIPLEAVDKEFLIPKTLAGNFPTDVIEARRFVSFDHEVAPGASISVDYDAPNVPACLAGTLGAIVKVGNFWYLLGSNHIMAMNGRVPILKRIYFNPPESFVDNPDDYIFGRLAAWVPLRPEGPGYDPNQPNQVDCAVALVENADRVTGEFPGRIVDCADIVDPVPGDIVTRVDDIDKAIGTVEEVGARVRIAYRFGTFDFDNMVLIKGIGGAFASPGDSGALVVTKGKPTAMIVGGSQNYAIACKLSSIRDAVKRELPITLPDDHREDDSFELVLSRLDDHVHTIESSLQSLFKKIEAHWAGKTSQL